MRKWTSRKRKIYFIFHILNRLTATKLLVGHKVNVHKTENQRYFPHFEYYSAATKFHVNGRSRNGKPTLLSIHSVYTSITSNKWKTTIFDILSISLNRYMVARKCAPRERKNYIILHTFNRPTIIVHNNMKMYIQEVAKTTLFYTRSI